MGNHGLRLGVQELTRTGMTPDDASDIAACIANALNGEDPDQLKARAKTLARRFDQTRFTSPLHSDRN